MVASSNYWCYDLKRGGRERERKKKREYSLGTERGGRERGSNDGEMRPTSSGEVAIASEYLRREGGGER